MANWTWLTSLAGGIGLFLLGMTMMTDGLRMAAGPALERILVSATRTRWHGLGSGMLVTSLVQSSSAVTVATIGFVNAGLLALGPALWVLFGANVGTTMTGWIVALVGLKFKIDLLAMPLVGVGVMLHLSGAGKRRGAVGTAMTGFGLLFMGIALLQTAFAGLAAQVSLPQGGGVAGVLAQLAVGVAMTVLMQSSSAAMTIAITAAQGGLLPPAGAAAVVIGANIGTTATAILAAMGATPNAKRAAAAHVVFNGLTGVVALLLLPWLLPAMEQARQWLALPADPATSLALFHTVFNLMGVLLMWPLAGHLTRWLQARFLASEGDEARPRHLDDTLLGVPSLALKALDLEVARVGHVAGRLARAVLAGAQPQALLRDQAVVAGLGKASQSFVERMNRAAMSQPTSEGLAHVLRLLRYHESVVEQAMLAAPLKPLAVGDDELTALQTRFLHHVDALLVASDPMPGATDAPPAADLAKANSGTDTDTDTDIDAGEGGDGEARRASQALAAAYEALKAALLVAGARGEVRLGDMEALLRRCSALRHAAEQAAKAWQRRLPKGKASTAHNPAPPATPLH